MPIGDVLPPREIRAKDVCDSVYEWEKFLLNNSGTFASISRWVELQKVSEPYVLISILLGLHILGYTINYEAKKDQQAEEAKV